jgi:hypothetical protein
VMKTLFKMLSLFVPLMLAVSPGHATPPSEPPDDLDLNASKWIEYNGHTPGNDAEGSLILDFPSAADDSCKATHTCDTINMLYTPYVKKVLTGRTLLISLKVETLTGSPVFQHTDTSGSCSFPPTVRAFFWAYNYGEGNGDRWWSDAFAYELAPGAVTWFIPLDPHTFRGVDGQLADSDSWHLHWWTSAIKNVNVIGVTFGGCNAYAHGIFTTGGTARFTLQNYETTTGQICPSVTGCNGTSCVRGATTGDVDLGYHACSITGQPSKTCLWPETVHQVSATCNKGSCCYAQPSPCVCPNNCPGGEYLECE